MSYQYDIFVSYRSQCTTTEWMRKTFIPEMKKLLTPLRPNGINFWIDDRIETGSNWPETLRAGLASSRLLLPMLTHFYFGSEWCRRELAIMLERQARLGFCSADNRRGL